LGDGLGDVSRLDAVLHAIALALDDDGLGVVEDASRMAEVRVASLLKMLGQCLKTCWCSDNGAAFVALADDLEEQVGPVFVDGQVADLVDHQQIGPGVLLEFLARRPALWAAAGC